VSDLQTAIDLVLPLDISPKAFRRVNRELKIDKKRSAICKFIGSADEVDGNISISISIAFRAPHHLRFADFRT
jgi:hypothetical protein